MTPKEIRRSPGGMTRVERIREADELVRKARFLADGCHANRRFSELGETAYYGWLANAVGYYANAGLGVMADRIDAVLRGDPEVAWIKFDHANNHGDLTDDQTTPLHSRPNSVRPHGRRRRRRGR